MILVFVRGALFVKRAPLTLPSPKLLCQDRVIGDGDTEIRKRRCRKIKNCLQNFLGVV